MEQLLAFAAALIALRLAGRLAVRWRTRRTPELAAWTAALLAYAVACAALAWGAAAGWDGRVFRVYYLFGGLLSAPLLGTGSLLLVRRRWVRTVMAVYTAIAITTVMSVRTHSVHGTGIPSAQSHLDFFPARLLALIGNSLGTLAVVSVALLTIRRRPLGNALIVAGIAVAAAGSALSGTLGEGGTAALLALGVVLLYSGFSTPTLRRSARSSLTRQDAGRLIP